MSKPAGLAGRQSAASTTIAARSRCRPANRPIAGALNSGGGAFFVGGEPLPIQGKLGKMFAPRFVGGIPRKQTAHVRINAALLGIARHPVLQGTPRRSNERGLTGVPSLAGNGDPDRI